MVEDGIARVVYSVIAEGSIERDVREMQAWKTPENNNEAYHSHCRKWSHRISGARKCCQEWKAISETQQIVSLLTLLPWNKNAPRSKARLPLTCYRIRFPGCRPENIAKSIRKWCKDTVRDG